MHFFLHETLGSFSQRMIKREKLPTEVLNLELSHAEEM